jgi:F0F1-type ATP synthase delta subunit
MEAREIAAKLFLLKAINDPTERLLCSLDLLKDVNVSNVLSEYGKILSGKMLVVSVISTITLSDSQRKKVEEKVRESVDLDVELQFVYEVQSDQKDSIRVSIEDKLFVWNE